jgi:hypothetical protein
MRQTNALNRVLKPLLKQLAVESGTPVIQISPALLLYSNLIAQSQFSIGDDRSLFLQELIAF